MSACPSEEELASFAVGAYKGAEAAALEAHISGCGRCRDWLERDKGAGSWLDGLRDEAGRTAFEVPPPAPDSRSSTAPTATQEFPEAGAIAPKRLKIPNCEVIRELGRGGQGVVYEAFETATKRRVAVKVLLSSAYGSRSARRRFEREIELVAQLRHPNIIAVHHANRLPEGRPYYLMDYAQGLPLHKFVRKDQLTLEETLRLFATICDAIQYAHQRGVIHRDLKPTNIVVDTDGTPRILDFGLAKAVAAPAQTLLTISQNVVGTLPYMSPEQAAANADAVDTRTDIYALGVILYELLTGSYPYPVGGHFPEVLRHISETPPTPPSRTWSAERGVQQRSEGRTRPGSCPIDKETETIIFNALAKEPERRYQSAGELAADVRRYLAGEPIGAKRDSGWYVLRKTVQRHRKAVLGAAAALLMLIAAAVVSTTAWRGATQARKDLKFAVELTDVPWNQALEETDLAGVLGLIRELSNLEEEVPASQLGLWAGRRSQADNALLNLVEAALVRNELAAVAEQLSTDQTTPTCLEILERLSAQPRGSSVTDRLCLRLERWIQVPPPCGYGQEMLDCSTALEQLNPTSSRPGWARALRAKLHDDMELVLDVDFSSYRGRDDLRNWQSSGAAVNLELVGDPTALFIPSVTAVRSLPIGEHNLVVRTVICFSSSDGEKTPRPSGHVTLNGKNRVCGFTVENGAFRRLGDPGPDSWEGRAEGLPVSLDRDYEIELRVDQFRSTFDVLIDDVYLIEEQPCTNDEEIENIALSATQGSRLLIRRVECRGSTRPLKRILGRRIPIVEERRLPIRPAGLLPLKLDRYVLHDFDGDGDLELAAADFGSIDSLSFYRAHSAWNLPESLQTLKFGTITPLRPAGVIEGRLAVFGFGLRSGLESNTGPYALRMFEFDGDFNHTETSLVEYSDGSDGSVTPILYSPTRRGFVIGLGYPARGIELFEGEPTAPGELPRSLGFFHVRVDEQPIPSDILSITPCDWDGDGDDDLILGLGSWYGYCAALVRLEGGSPLRMSEPPDGTHNLGRWVNAEPLTGQIGKTRTALSTLGTTTPCLFAVAGRAETPNSDEHTSGEGILICRLSGDGVAFRPFDRLIADEDGHEVCAGRLAGCDVVATLSSVLCKETQLRDFVVRLFGAEGQKVVPIWKATLLARRSVCNLRIGDIDNDGYNDLIVSDPEEGLFVFSADSED